MLRQILLVAILGGAIRAIQGGSLWDNVVSGLIGAVAWTVISAIFSQPRPRAFLRRHLPTVPRLLGTPTPSELEDRTIPRIDSSAVNEVYGKTISAMVAIHSKGLGARFSGTYRIVDSSPGAMLTKEQRSPIRWIWTDDPAENDGDGRMWIAKGNSARILLAEVGEGKNGWTTRLQAGNGESPGGFNTFKERPGTPAWCEIELAINSEPDMLESPKLFTVRIDRHGAVIVGEAGVP